MLVTVEVVCCVSRRRDCGSLGRVSSQPPINVNGREKPGTDFYSLQTTAAAAARVANTAQMHNMVS